MIWTRRRNGAVGRLAAVTVLLASMTVSSAGAQPAPVGPTLPPPVLVGSPTARQLAASMDIPAIQILEADLQGSDPVGTATAEGSLAGFPTANRTFAIL